LKVSVPGRDSTRSGVLIAGGMSVVVVGAAAVRSFMSVSCLVYWRATERFRTSWPVGHGSADGCVHIKAKSLPPGVQVAMHFQHRRH
jgi:hypothetical protein